MTNKIHPTAIIVDGAKIGKNVNIGPYCVIGANVEIGDGTVLKSHVVIDGITKIGQNNIIFSFAAIGHAPQDLKYEGEKSQIIIGDNNKIREYVTIHPGTKSDKMVTKIGDNCLLMVSSHIAHDCVIGNDVILANNATLGGHVMVEDHAVLGGLCAVHQFVRIGKHAMIGGMSGVENDVIPYGTVMGERAYLAGLNLIGLKRRGFERDAIHSLRNFYKKLFDEDSGSMSKNITTLKEEYKDDLLVIEIINFLETKNSRAICKPKSAKDE